jgi:hypothetical protein
MKRKWDTSILSYLAYYIEHEVYLKQVIWRFIYKEYTGTYLVSECKMYVSSSLRSTYKYGYQEILYFIS